MRILILPIISFIVLFLVITGISLFIPSHIRISKAIDISVDKETVMEQIKDITKWKNWYPGTDSLEIFYLNEKPEGLMRDSTHIITRITNINDTSVVATIAARHLKKIVIGWNILSGYNTANVSVQWYMDFHFHWYPWEKLRSLTFEKTYGVQMEKGLDNLKTLLEK